MTATPLSAAEEATLRRALAESNGPNDDVGYAVFGYPAEAEEAASRLLATLDQARRRKSVYVRLPAERFWEKVDRSGECWLWMGALNRTGYGLFRATHGGKAGGASLAHRYAYRLAHEHRSLSASDVVMHTCDNPRCVNPDHLVLGSHADNVADKITKADRIAHLEAELLAERQARADERRRLRAGIEALPSPTRYENDRNGNWWTTDMEYGWDEGIEAVLALLADDPEPGA